MVSKLHARQAKESYNLESTIYVILEPNDEHVALEFRLSGDSLDRTDEQVEREVVALLVELVDSWDKILATISKSHVGDRNHPLHVSDEMHMHVIRRFTKDGKRWN